MREGAMWEGPDLSSSLGCSVPLFGSAESLVHVGIRYCAESRLRLSERGGSVGTVTGRGNPAALGLRRVYRGCLFPRV